MRSFLLVLLAVWAGSLAAKDPVQIRPQPANTYAARDGHEGVTIAGQPYDQEDKRKEVFGKYDPMRVSVLPVYVVITNSSTDAVRLDRWEVQLIAADRSRASAIPAGTVSLMVSGQKVPSGAEPPRGPIPRLPQRYDPKAVSAIVDRELVLKMVPPGETVGGFLFFDTARRAAILRGAQLYLTGLTWARTGKELLFFEVRFDDYLKGK
jgi:hypothetical protein